MEYQRVFDITDAGYANIWFPAWGLLFVTIGFIFVIYRRWLWPKALRRVPMVVVGFGIIWTVAALYLTLFPYLRLSAALREGHCTITEGIISDFHPMPRSGHGFESFVVSGQRFKYSDYVLTPGFRQTHLHGSPIRNGLYVRIYHVGNNIARLEIARSSTNSQRLGGETQPHPKI